MALTTLSNWLMQNDESVDRQKTKNACTVAPGYTSLFFTNPILNDIHDLFVYGCTSIERTYFVT